MTDINSKRPGSRKIDLTHIPFTQRYDILGNPMKEDPRHLAQDIWQYRINEEDAFKNELGLLDSPIAKILEWLYLSGSDNPRIRNREWLKRLGLTDTQITSLRMKSLRIWLYIHQLLDFRNRLEYSLYDLHVGHIREVEELKRMQGELCRRNDYLLRYHPVDSSDFPLKNISFDLGLNAPGNTIKEQAKQLAQDIRKKLIEEDEMDENYEKLDPLVYGVLREFYYSRWDSPRIENRGLFKGKYKDSQITQARKKAMKMWPYIRIIMDLRDQPESASLEETVYELLMNYTMETQKLKKNVIILLKRNEELLRYNRTLIETNSNEKNNGN